MGAYIIRRILLMVPTLLGILFVSFVVVQFAPGGPVERVIALTGEEAEAGLARLRAAGIEAAPGQTIGALSGGHRGRQAEILSVIFAGG